MDKRQKKENKGKEKDTKRRGKNYILSKNMVVYNAK